MSLYQYAFFWKKIYIHEHVNDYLFIEVTNKSTKEIKLKENKE